jgi:colicin import membrane protein
MFALSFVSHLGLFSLVLWSMSSPQFHPAEEQITYVDMISPPVTSPQVGTPAPAEEQTRKPPVAPQTVRLPAKRAPVPPKVAAMPLPVAKPKPTKVIPAGNVKVEKPIPAEDGREFEERLARIQQKSEDKRQAEVLDLLRKGTKKIVGMPSGKGIQAGSDYSSYIQSRLKDAFREVIASQTRAPQVLVRIAIGPDGRITKYRVEKNSGDPVFDEAVSRAVTFAGRSLKPPPGGVPFERVFRFKPEGVGVS